MISDKIKDRLRKVSGIWLVFMGVVVIASGIYGFPRFVEGTGDILYGGIMFSVLLVLLGILVAFAGVLALHESSWIMCFTLSIILCIVLVVLSPIVVYPFIGYVFLGISAVSAVFLLVARSEF